MKRQVIFSRRRPCPANRSRGRAIPQTAFLAKRRLHVSSKTMFAKKDYRWQIYHIKSTPAKFIGTVTAPDEETALSKAISELEIDPKIQQRARGDDRSGLPCCSALSRFVSAWIGL